MTSVSKLFSSTTIRINSWSETWMAAAKASFALLIHVVSNACGITCV
jgi:hypothetical protein